MRTATAGQEIAAAPMRSTSLGVTAAAVVLFGTWSGGVQPSVDEYPVKEAVVAYADWAMAGSSSGPDFRVAATTTLPSDSEMVQQLKDESGLTADQLGKALGVTRRSVHNWAAGAAIAPKHQARLQQLHDLVFGIAAAGPDERRDILLDSATGPSLYRVFADGTTRPARVEYPVPVIERFA